MAAVSFAAHDVPKVRVLVVGDSGVGKSALTHVLCHGGDSDGEGGGDGFFGGGAGRQTTAFNAAWTVGCAVDVRLHEYRARENAQQKSKDYFVEFFDVGGSKKFEPSRKVFYSKINGILLVFDVTNRKSFHNLRRWIRQIVLADKVKPIEESYAYTGSDLFPGSHSPNVSSYASRSDSISPSPHVAGLNIQDKQPPAHRTRPAARLGSLPVLVVGNKMDLHEGADPPRFNSLKEFGLECVYTSCVGDLHEESAQKLDAFFNRVIERRFYRTETPGTRLVFSPLGNFVQRRESVHQLTELDGPLAATSPLPSAAAAAGGGVGSDAGGAAGGSGGAGAHQSSYARVAGAHLSQHLSPPSSYPYAGAGGSGQSPASVYPFRPAGLGYHGHHHDEKSE